MMYRFALASTLLLLSSLRLLAAADSTPLPMPGDFTDTRTIRLDAPGGSMEHVAIRNQIGGTCYSYTAAEMYDAARFSSGDARTDLVTSGFAAAIEYKKKFLQKNPDGGHVCGIAGVMPGLRHKGACSTKALPAKRNGVSLAWVAGQLKKAWRQTREDPAPGIAAPRMRELIVKPTLLDYGMRLKDIPRDEELDALLQKKSLTKLYDRTLVDPSCSQEDRIEWEVRRCKAGVSLAKSTASRVAKVNSLLRLEDAQPIEISFCASILIEGMAVFEDPKKWNAALFDSDACGNHATLIIGRRISSEGRQEFLIRNSWGKGCLAYAPEWECEKGRANIWVDAESLMKTVYGMAYLKRP